jgi:large subunit ribosomal protein L30e
MVKKSGA